MKEYKQVWRYDSFYKTVKETEIDISLAPIGVWLPVLVGEGYYVYFNTLKEAKEAAIAGIKDQIEELKDAIKEIENIYETS